VYGVEMCGLGVEAIGGGIRWGWKI
jgi:hypothetical protein